MGPRRIAAGVVLVLVALSAACSAQSPTASTGADAPSVAGSHRLFGATELLSDVAGTEIVVSHVVPMTCIPTRTDPVGVFLSLEIVDWQVADDEVAISMRPNYTKLGSHPSGCSDPTVVFEDSMFLLGPDDETLHVSNVLEIDDATTVVFELADSTAGSWSAVLLPTIDYALGNGDRQTSIFGLVGHYELG